MQEYRGLRQTVAISRPSSYFYDDLVSQIIVFRFVRN